MLDSEFLIYDKRAGKRHVQIGLGFALILLLGSAAMIPGRLHQLERIAIFVPVLDTMHLLFSCIIAAVLYAMGSVLRARALTALATGYACVGFLAVAHALTYPLTFSPTGFFGSREDSPTWIYLVWHTMLPAAIIVYALLKERPQRPGLRGPNIALCLAGAALPAVVTVWMTTGPSAYNDLERDRVADIWHFAVLLLNAGTILLLWRGRRSILDLVLMLTLWTWFLEYVLVLPSAARFSVGWYAGRVMGLFSGLVVLLMLLIEMSRLYARTVMLIAAQSRERDNRLMLGEAVGGFISHELRQPLAAIGLNAYTAQKLGVDAGSELARVLDDLVQDSRHAADVIESTRALFGGVGGDRRPTDINQLICDTLLMTSQDLRNRNVKVRAELDANLPLVSVNRLQMQQVFLNLFFNAVEAMSEMTERPRELTIRSRNGNAGLVIQVEDNGPSIAAGAGDKIFAPFFSTKKQGTGMGLSICRSVMQAHGGSIQVFSQAPFGVSFEILLPWGEQPVPSPRAEKSAAL